MNKPRLAALAALAAAALALTACGAPAAAGSGDGSAPAVVKWGVTALNPNWDPIVTGATGATLTMTPIYESLITRGEDGQLHPALAESWEYNDTGDAVTFTLREGLTFHDGSPVDAEAVKYFIERAKTQTNSALAGSYSNIDAVEVVDPLTFVVTLKEVDYQLPYLLSNRAGLITSKVAAEKDPQALNTSLPVGAGPFKVVKLVPEDEIILEKNPDYWDAEQIHIDRIEIHGGNDASTLVSSLQTGVYNFATISPALVQQAETAGFDVINDPKTNWVISFLSLNLNKAPFDDPRVVEAVRLAVDRDEIVKKAYLGYAEPVHQVFPDGHLGWDESLESDDPYDPERARELLAEAGYGDGDLSLTLYPFSSGDAAAEIVQSQLAAVGITVDISVDPNWAKGYFGKDYALALYGYVGRDSYVQALTEHFAEGGVLNLSSPYTSPEFAAALQSVRATPTDSPDYPARLSEAAAAGYRNGSTVALTTASTIWAKDPSISDSTESIEGRLGWKGVTITP
ncbi:ABC transporter substrate-binding protein [Microbacterium telephonicum]|uniref:Peptide/nickel transport system substrate-binding protein n=1 Tax=Microbacterium telephonicum TaxID=1714841 RepID=A0A498CB19_9MICO|nr:ABC transporter substrate-binding protein [Microbacterium telephonicum]RLK52683.1 peptide/nickel transport system substrate-binding protein [Microbacterium telephonicum]